MVKKQQTLKKTSVTKKTKKPTTKRAAKARVDTRRVAVGVLATIAAFFAATVLAFLTLSAIQHAETTERKDRIQAIYQSLNLSPTEYQMEKSDIFGDKRIYEWDKGRTYSSVMQYSHGDTVSNTAKELDAVIKSAGFSFISEPYPGAQGSIQYHYKSQNGEYIRLTVESKQRFDAIRNAAIMGDVTSEKLDEIFKSIDANVGPVNVTIKVNLDDNNE